MKKSLDSIKEENLRESLRALTKCVQRICRLNSDSAIDVEKPEAKLLAPADVAVRIGVSRKTLANWRSQRVGPSSVKIGGRVAYKAADLEAWIADRPVTVAIQNRRAR